MTYTKLFEKGKIGRLELKNRIVMPAMGCSLASSTGEASQEMITYYAKRAKGGAGLIITEITRIDDETGVGTPNQLSVTDLKHIPQLTRLAEAVHAYNTKIFVQLHHPGNQTPSRLLHGKQIVSASDVTCSVVGEKPRALTTEEVEGLVKKFVFGAYVAKAAGIDGVELHAAHGYLLDQFMSPHTNKRTDRYGGDFNGRMRMITEIIKGIQATCGPDYPISVRMDGAEYIPDGIDQAEGIKIAKYLETLGIQALNVSCGTYESGYTIVEPAMLKEGWKADLARQIKANVSIPVIAVNTIKHPAFAESLLEEDVCDFVGIARGFLADAEWGTKAQKGQDLYIRKCIGCLECFRILNTLRPVECTLNPLLGRELHWGHLHKTGQHRKVAVLGGGPAGMEAAIVLAKRQFDVTLFEATDKLGGTMNLAAIPPHKELLGEFVETMAAQVEAAGVQVVYNTKATPEDLKEAGFEAIFMAIGGQPIVPNLPGIDQAITAESVLKGEHDLHDQKIVIIGGGVTGLETAETLAKDNQVMVIEMANQVGTTLYASYRGVLLKEMHDMGITIKTEHRLTHIEDHQVYTKHGDEDVAFEADTVVLAMGVKPKREALEDFEKVFDQVILLGDTDHPGQIREALHSAYDRAFVFDLG